MIIDYKTGKNVPDEKKLATDMQLTMYALAATEVRDQLFNRRPEHVSLALHYVEEGKKLITNRTKEQLLEAKEYILQKVGEIEKSNFQCSITNCKNCEYAILCQTFSG
jgi:RecB family exonuclease